MSNKFQQKKFEKTQNMQPLKDKYIKNNFIILGSKITSCIICIITSLIRIITSNLICIITRANSLICITTSSSNCLIYTITSLITYTNYKLCLTSCLDTICQQTGYFFRDWILNVVITGMGRCKRNAGKQLQIYMIAKYICFLKFILK